MGFGMPNPGGDWYKASSNYRANRTSNSVPDRAKDPKRLRFQEPQSPHEEWIVEMGGPEALRDMRDK